MSGLLVKEYYTLRRYFQSCLLIACPGFIDIAYMLHFH